MAWIESHQKLKDHPKVLKLMTLMGWDLDQAIGKLHRFWWWCVDYAEDGDLRKHDSISLAYAISMPSINADKFLHAMIESKWIDNDPYLRVHDWWDYAGRFLQSRYSHSPEKWRSIRLAYAKHTTHNITKPHNITKHNITKRYSAFAKPNFEDLKNYANELNFKNFNPQAFLDYYESKGWIVGKTPMKNWKASVRTWKRNNFNSGGSQNGTRKITGTATVEKGKYEHLGK